MQKIKRKKTILIITVVIIFTVILIRSIGGKTINAEADSISEKIHATAFIVQEEDIIRFSGANSLDIKVEEGVKVSLDTVVANSNNLKLTNQEAMDYDIVNKKIEGKDNNNNNIFDNDLNKLDSEISMLQSEIDNAEDDKTREKFIEDKNDLEDKKKRIEGAFRYAFSDSETLSDVKNQMSNNARAVEGQITPKSMGLTYGGYVFYEEDGLESLLHKDLLGDITTGQYNDIKEYVQNQDTVKENRNNNQIIKFVDDTKMYMILKVPDTSFQKEEKRYIDIKKNVDTQWKEEGQTDFYSYIETRRDVLRRFPRINIEYKNDIISGYLLDVNRESDDRYKVLTVKINTHNHKLIGQRKLDISVISQ